MTIHLKNLTGTEEQIENLWGDYSLKYFDKNAKGNYDLGFNFPEDISWTSKVKTLRGLKTILDRFDYEIRDHGYL